jgi:predicted porin
LKKQLLCTSAIALGVAAAPAAAQDWNLDWGGFYNTHVAYADVGGSDPRAQAAFGGAAYNLIDFTGMNVVGNGEIIFTPSITLDNGMTFGINVQLEAQNQGTGEIDESYVFVSSDTLGRIEMGGENSAGYKLMVGAPGVGSFGINSGSVTAVAPIAAPFRSAAGSSFTEVAGNNDVQRISYFTPDFNGFTAGISYAPGNASNASNTGVFARNNGVAGTNVTDIFDIGLNYSGTFGAATVTVGARWGTGDRPAFTVTQTAGVDGLDGTVDDVFTLTANPGSDPETWGVGFQVGYNAITFGMAYAENSTGNPVAINGDQKSIAFGITYDVAGPWSIGFEGIQGETETGALDQEYNAYKLAASREIGPGVSMDLYAITAENNDIGGVAIQDRDVTIFGTSLNLSF